MSNIFDLHYIKNRLIYNLKLIKNIYLLPFEKEITFLRKKKFLFDLSIDCGSNRGYYSHVLSNISRKVISFDPINLFKNDNAKIDYYQYGLYSSNCKKNIFIPNNNSRNDYAFSTFKKIKTKNKIFKKFKKKLCHLVKLDDFLLNNKYKNKKVSFIKIDAEGTEYDVLVGSLNTLKKYKPILLIEIILGNNSEYYINKICKLLKELNYKSLYLDNQLEKISIFNLVNFISSQKKIPIESKNKIYNFFFVNTNNKDKNFLNV
jgi:FkbM family methyltransferase